MEDHKLISVIIPVFNTEKYLARCVNSVLSQTYRNLEIILVDDGSYDKSGEICDEFANRDSRIRVIHKENGGVSSARNAGLDAVSGEYIGFIDSDDIAEPVMYETLMQSSMREDADIVCCGTERVSDRGHEYYFNDHTDEFLVLDRQSALCELTYNNRITNSLCDKLYRKEIFNNLRFTDGIIYEDHEIMHKCLYRAEKTVYIGAPLYKYYMNSKSLIGGTTGKRHFAFFEAGKERLKFYETYSPSNLPLAKAQYAQWALDLIYKSRKSDDCKALRKELIKDTKRFLSENGKLPFVKNTKIRAAAFKLSPLVYTVLLDVFYIFRKLCGKHRL